MSDIGLFDQISSHLALLFSQNVSVVQEFCRLSIQLIDQEINPKTYNSAANKLGVEANQVTY